MKYLSWIQLHPYLQWTNPPPNSPSIEASPSTNHFFTTHEDFYTHLALVNGILNTHKTLTLDHFQVTSNISPSVEIKLSKFVTSASTPLLQSVRLHIPTFKFYRHYRIWTDQFTLIYLLLHPLITSFVQLSSRYTYHFGENSTPKYQR